MKAIILLACLSGAIAFSVDYENLVPVYETDEWKAARPGRASIDTSKFAKPVYQRGGRIWGEAPFARDALQGEVPHQAGLLIATTPRSSFCGGSIVSLNFIMSAAQCFAGDVSTVAEMGHVDRTLTPVRINVVQWILHPLFDAGESANDIALLRLADPISFTANILPVRLPARSQRTLTFENQVASITGWGGTGGIIDSNPIRHLRVGFAQIISQAACRVRFPSTSTDHTLCIDGTNVNFCDGDYGGPVTIFDLDGVYTQIGIASFTQVTGCTRGFPGGITRVSLYLDWIALVSDIVIRNEF